MTRKRELNAASPFLFESLSSRSVYSRTASSASRAIPLKPMLGKAARASAVRLSVVCEPKFTASIMYVLYPFPSS